MVRKNLVYILFYFSLVCLGGAYFYLRGDRSVYQIVFYGGFLWFGITIVHLLLASFVVLFQQARQRQKKTSSPSHSSRLQDDLPIKKTSVKDNGGGSFGGQKKSPAPNKPIAKAIDKSVAVGPSVNALQDILSSAYQNKLLVGMKSIVMVGHSVVSAQDKSFTGFYCQGYLQDKNGGGGDIPSVIAASDKTAVIGEIEILLLEALRLYWQKLLRDKADIPYFFVPISQRALNEKGFFNDLKSFLKAQRIQDGHLNKIYSKLIFVLPYSINFYRHSEACQFLLGDGIKLALLYMESFGLANPMIEEDVTVFRRQGVDFFLLPFEDLEKLQDKLGYEVMSKKLLSLENLRLNGLVFNVHDETLYNKLPRGISMVMGNLVDKQTVLSSLPLA